MGVKDQENIVVMSLSVQMVSLSECHGFCDKSRMLWVDL